MPVKYPIGLWTSIIVFVYVPISPSKVLEHDEKHTIWKENNTYQSMDKDRGKGGSGMNGHI